MSSHYASNSSKSKSKLNLKVIPFKRRAPMAKADFRVDNHGSLILLHPLTQAGLDYVNENIGSDNGFQPLWPVVVFEPRYISQFIHDIRLSGLLAR
jgi:hypothetical protein